jgi:phasin family protein
MLNALEPSMTMYTAQLRTTRRVVDACLSGVERVDHIMLQAAKDMLHDEIEQAGAMAKLRTPGELVAYAQSHMQPTVERMVARNAELMQAIAQTGAETMNAAQGFMIKASAEAENVAEAKVGEAAFPFFNTMPMSGMIELWNKTSRQFNDMLLRAQPISHPSNGKGNAAQAGSKKRST